MHACKVKGSHACLQSWLWAVLSSRATEVPTDIILHAVTVAVRAFPVMHRMPHVLTGRSHR